ncbi:MAG: hypothetical protein ACMZ64_02025 [Oleiphilus sp.]
MIRVLSMLMIFLMLSGCGHHRYFKGFEEIPVESASVYVIRPSSLASMVLSIEIKVGDQNIGYLKNGHFLNTFIQPGEHKVIARALGSFGRQQEIMITPKPNERIYLLAGFGLEGYFGIEQVDEKTALEELREFTEE